MGSMVATTGDRERVGRGRFRWAQALPGDRGHRLHRGAWCPGCWTAVSRSGISPDPDKLANVPWRSRIEVAKGDLGDPASLDVAFADVDIVYHLVHSMGFEKDFAAEERRAAQNVVAAARRAGVRRIVYLSGLHPEGAELSTHLSSRTTVGRSSSPRASRPSCCRPVWWSDPVRPPSR